MPYVLLFFLFITNCNSKKQVTHNHKFCVTVLHTLYNINDKRQLPSKESNDSIIESIIFCQKMTSNILTQIQTNYLEFNNSINFSKYFLHINYDTLATIFLKLYFNHNNPGEIDFGMAHLIRSQLLLPVYYKNLCNIKPWWRYKKPPPGYFMNGREMPSPIRICDMALDGIIYSKYKNKTDYYQQFFSKDSFDLSTILITNNWSSYLRHSDKIQSIRDSIIDDLVNGKDLR